MGGLVTIPGAPLPPVSKDVVVTSIKVFEPMLAGLRLFGETAAVGRGCGYLATLYAAMGDDARTEQLFKEGERILQKSGAHSSDRGWLRNNRGMWHLESGRHTVAIRDFRGALLFLNPTVAETRELHIIVLQNLASAYWLLGDPDQAHSTYDSALDLLTRSGIEGGKTSQKLRANIAQLDSSIGEYAAAVKACETLLAESGLDRPVRFSALLTLGVALASLREFNSAEARLLEALALTAERSSERFMVLSNLAATYGTAQDWERTESVGQEVFAMAKEIYGEHSRMAGAAMMTLGLTALSRNELVAADRLLTRATGLLKENPGDEEVLIFATRELALVAQMRAQTERAMTLSRQALASSKEQLARILAFGSETQRLAYHARARPFDQLANLGDPILLADAILSMKGVVLESLLAERALARRSRTPADRDELDRIHELKLRLLEETGRGNAASESLQRELSRTATALTRRLSIQFTNRQVPIDLKKVQQSLSPDEVLVEVIRYERHLGRARVKWAYGALVIGCVGPPEWVPIGDADAIDPRIEEVIRRVGANTRSATPTGIRESEGDDELRVELRALHEALWAPLTRAMPAGTRHVMLSPDGETSFVPWSALLDANDHFVAERWRVTQVGSARQVLDPPSQPPARTLMALADGRGDLAYSRREVDVIARTAQHYGWRPTILMGEQATEREVQRQKGPTILHFATHGGQLGDDDTHVISRRFSANPMYRGYLLLQGGDETLRRWKDGESVPAEEDGILMAEEVSGLNLSDTWLTVLAACDTGAGVSRTGEGVLGLRRGFALAGTRYLLFSLWPVNDQSTAQFMEAFYQRVLAGGNPSTAFHDTQQAELLHWKQTRNLASAVVRAGAFVLTR